MFGFKKKEKPAPRKEAVQEHQSQEFKRFAAEFLPEETRILAVTSAGGFRDLPAGESGLHTVSIGLTAWMDQYTKEVQQEETVMMAMVEEKLLDCLRAQMKADSILEVTVRRSKDGRCFWFTDLPRPGYDPELKAILEEQMKPVTLEVEGIGVFTLNRAPGWFEHTVDWLGTETPMVMYPADEHQEVAQETASILFRDRESWDARLRSFVIEQLLETLREMTGEAITPEAFQDGLVMECILTNPKGGFTVWFDIRTLLPQAAAVVDGTLEQGPVKAEVEV